MVAGVWFRKCLRLHDNAALTQAVAESPRVVPFFVLDPHFTQGHVGVNRYQFLLESLRDLDGQLREKHESRLLVLRGRPEEVIQDLFNGEGPFKLTSLFWEKDSEPYAQHRDANIMRLAIDSGVQCKSFLGHTLLDLETTVASKGFKLPISMSGIQALVNAAGSIPHPLPVPNIPVLKLDGFEVPDISEFYDEKPRSSGFPGGEREGLRRLHRVCSDVAYVCDFEKPKTSSTGKPGSPWEASTTGLSPYLKFGCVSVRSAWYEIAKCYEGRTHAKPPTSLHGQILFREMFYVLGAAVPNFDKADGNSMCKPMPWGEDPRLLSAWEEGHTGFPFIDALMRQLKQTGWMHHLGRHAVACFLTRGDLWQNWTVGRDVFDRLLLDSDWAINNGNWLWLAGVAPFSSPYFRIYDPCPGPKSSLNAEQTGEFVKHYVPELRSMPAKYIYKPWTAPADVQRKAGCIIGKDYPAPIVDHKTAREANLAKFKATLDAAKSGALPTKFGTAQRDPGPMRSTLAAAAAVGAAAVNARGKGKGGGKRRGPENAEGSATAAASTPEPKQRRWGGGRGSSNSMLLGG